MTLAELESLARAARNLSMTVDETQCAEWDLKDEFSPERVLALLAVVKAAKAMRERTRFERVGALHDSAEAFDAALAALDEEQQT